jgi:hypothetical protein
MTNVTKIHVKYLYSLELGYVQESISFPEVGVAVSCHW